jgi:hypothetical protein
LRDQTLICRIVAARSFEDQVNHIAEIRVKRQRGKGRDEVKTAAYAAPPTRSAE